MMKMIENMFYKSSKSHIATLPYDNQKQAGARAVYQKPVNERIDISNEYEEVKTSSENNGWSSLNFMQWFVKEPLNGESLPYGENDSMKIGGDGKNKNRAVYSSDADPSNTIKK